MEHKLLRGKTIDEKLSSVDKILIQFQRRLGTKVIGMLPPIPLLFSCAEPSTDGLVCAGIFPIKGKITHASIYVGEYAKKEAEFSLAVLSNGVIKSLSQVLSKQVENIVLDMDVDRGTVIKVTTALPVTVREILLGIDFQPDLGTYNISSYALQQAEALTNLQVSEVNATLEA